MGTMRKGVEFLAEIDARNCGGTLRCGVVSVCVALMTCCTAFGSPARAEEPKQVAARAQGEEDTSRESVLVSFTLSAPEGVEDEVAKEHNLELVSKLPLPTLGMRVVRYAVPDARPIATVLERLRADQRVSSAQVNVQYRQIEPNAPDTVVGSVPIPQEAGPRKSAARKSIVRREASLSEGRRPARIAVGDVLAGGL